MNEQPETSAPRTSLAWFAVRLVVAYVLLSVFVHVFPSAYPRLLAPLLSCGAGVISRTYDVEKVAVSNGDLQVKATTSQLARFNKDGMPGPTITFDATLKGRVVNIYPVMVLALVVAWPGLSWRARGKALGLAVLLLLLVGFVDLYILSRWQSAQAVTSYIPSMQIPSTPENLAAYESIKAHVDRLKVAKSFLSTGGRQFMAVLAFLLAVAPVYLKKGGSARTQGEPDTD